MQEQDYLSEEADSLRIQEQSEIEHMDRWVSPQKSLNRNNKLMQSIQKIKRNLTTSLLQPSSNMNHQHHSANHSHQIQKLTSANAILQHKLQISRLSHKQLKQANEQLKQSLREVSQMLDEYNSEKGRKEEVEQTVEELLRGGEYRKGMRVVLGLRITLELDRLEVAEVVRRGDGEVIQKKQQQVQTQNIEQKHTQQLQNQLTQLKTQLSNKQQQLITLQTSLTSTLTQHQLTTQSLKQQLQTSERRLADYIKMNNEHTLELKKKMELIELELKNVKRLNCRLEKVIAGKDREIGWLRMEKVGSRVSEEEWREVDSFKLIEENIILSDTSLKILKPTTSQSSTQSILPLYQHKSTQTIHSQLLPPIPPPIQQQIHSFQMIITHLTQQKDFKRGLYNFKTTFKPKRNQPPGTQIFDYLVLAAVNFIKRVDEEIDAVIEKYEILPQKGFQSRIMKSTLVSDIRPAQDQEQERKVFAQKERQYEVEIQELNKKMSQLNEKLVGNQNMYQAQVMRLKGQLDVTLSQLTKCIEEKRDYTISMEQLKRSFAKNADEITRLRQQRMQLEKKYDNNKQRIRVLQKNCQQLQGLTKSLREQIKQLKSRNEQLAKRKK